MTLPSQSVSQSRVLWLDELRGIAAFSVVIFHYFTNYDQHYNHSFTVPDFLSYGYLGVPLFFIISGFVIFMTVSKINSLPKFIISRFSRLYPVYWVAATLTFLWTLNFGPSDRIVSTQSYFINLLMIQEYLSIPHVDRVYWTLTIELAFYFWISVLLITKQLTRINYFLIAAVLAAIFYDQVPVIIRQLLLLKYISFFAAGICFYNINKKQNTIFTNIILLLVSIHIIKYYPLVECFILFSALAYFYYCCTKEVKTTNKILVYLGTISYSLYLIHQNIGYSLIKLGYTYNIEPLLTIFLTIIFSLILASLLTHLIEKPTAKLCKKLTKRLTN